MNRRFFILFFICSFIIKDSTVFAQSSEPNWISRQADFEDRRSSESTENFAELYFKASADLDKSRMATKTGDEWTPLGPLGDEDLNGYGRVNSMQFHPKDSNTWYICVAQAGVWKTSNAGQTWTSISSDLPVLRTSYLAIHPDHPDTMYLATGDFAYLGHNLQANENKRNSHYGLGVYKTVNGGASWFATGLSFEQIDFEGSLISKIFIRDSDPNQILAVGQTGAYISKDAGAQWTKTNSSIIWDLEQDPYQDSVLYASTGYVHAYGIGQVSILKSTDFGASWTASNINVPTSGHVQRIDLAIAPTDANYIYAIACDSIGGFYGLYQSTDAGISFQERSLGTSYPINILNNSLDAKSGGQGRYDLSICVDRYDKNKFLIGGINIWQSSDGGASFEPISYWPLNYQDIGVHADIHELVLHPANNSVFACHDGGLSRAFNIIPNTVTELKSDGICSTVWTDYSSGLNITSFYRLSINQETGSELMAGSQDNNTVYTDGDEYYNLSGGDGMESVFYDQILYRYSSSQNGRLYEYFWDGVNFYYNDAYSPPFGEIGEWTSPFVAAAGAIYVGYGNIYKIEDGSLSGSLSNFSNANGKPFPSPATALAVDSANGQYIYVAKRGYQSSSIGSEVWMSSNSGTNWTNISSGLPSHLYPSYLELNEDNALEIWITYSGFDEDEKVFYSKNGGSSWDNITLDLPNIPVNTVCLHELDQTIYIGTDLGVFYLRKDSNQWVYFSEGLPKVIVSELEINKNSNTLVAATFGRGLWEIGILAPLVDSTTSISTPPIAEFLIFPNPVGSVLNISLSEPVSRTSELRVLDVTGKLWYYILMDQASNKELNLDVTHLNSGEYFVILSDKKSRQVIRFIKLE